MSDIFGGESDSLEDELGQLIEFGDQLDKLNSLSLLVVLSERVLREKVQTFLGKLLGLALVQGKGLISSIFVIDSWSGIQKFEFRKVCLNTCHKL